jgi:Polyketide cyclase / dehydrase and lipid transport
MKPITFSCTEALPLAPEDIARQILDLANWTDFTGYGVLPGIRAAEFEVRTPGVVGTRIRVTNTDGSGHVEEVVEWQPDRRVRLAMKDFSPPLSRLATGFEETWEFERLGDGTRVVRSFALHPKTALARPVLWLVSILLKRAIGRHLSQMRRAAGQPQEG